MLLNESGKWTFSKVADDYDAVRPLYPADLVHTLISETGLSQKDRALEIGCGTGQLTRALAPYGFQLHAIDIGRPLIRIAEVHCQDYPNVTFSHSSFEALPNPSAKYQTIMAATAFHWLDPASRFQKCATLLPAGGFLVIINNVSLYQQKTGPLRRKLDEIYERVIPIENSRQYVSLASKRGNLEQEFRNDPNFGPLAVFTFPYTHRLSGKDYIRLLNTFSYQHNLPTAVKDQLFQEIGIAISEAGGTIHLPYEAVLYLAQKQLGSA